MNFPKSNTFFKRTTPWKYMKIRRKSYGTTGINSISKRCL